MMLMLFSRGGLLILFSALIIFLLLIKKTTKFYIYGGMFLSLVYFVFRDLLHLFLQRFTTLYTWLSVGQGGESITKRIILINDSLKVGFKQPLLGVGGYNLNMFVEKGTHNQFLNMFVENGIFTFGLYCLIILLILFSLISIFQKFDIKSKEDRKLTACFIAIMFGSIIQGNISYLRHEFWVITALIVAWIIINKQKHIYANKSV